MKPLAHYETKFENVAPNLIKSTYRNNGWMLPILERYLKDPKQCHTSFFKFMCAKLKDIGQPGIQEVLDLGIPLYQFVQEHEARKKQRVS